MTSYPLARSVTPVEGGVNGRNAQPIVTTSEQSWAEMDMAELLTGRVELNAGKDRPGPITLAAAVSAPSAEAPKPDAPPEGPKPEARVVVYGDSDFASNGDLGVPGNKDLFMNTLGWLSQQENLISIRTKEASDRRLTMTEAQQSNVNWLSLLGLPVIIFGMGIYSWRRRRG